MTEWMQVLITLAFGLALFRTGHRRGKAEGLESAIRGNLRAPQEIRYVGDTIFVLAGDGGEREMVCMSVDYSHTGGEQTVTASFLDRATYMRRYNIRKEF